MNTVRIAILDDPVYSPPKQSINVVKWIPGADGEFQKWTPEEKENSGYLGHGDTCLQIISKYIGATPIELHCFQCFEEGQTSGIIDHMLKALDICCTLNVQIVHMSIGSITCQDFCAIRKKVEILHEQKVVLVAALSNKNKVTFPAWIPGVFSVCVDHKLKDGDYYLCDPSFKHITFCASGKHLLHANGQFFFTSPANSYAAPVITARVVCEISNNPGITPDQLLKKVKANAVSMRKVQEESCDDSFEFDVPVIWLHGFSDLTEKKIIRELQNTLGKQYLCVGVCKTAQEENFILSLPYTGKVETFLKSILSFFCPDVLCIGENRIGWNDVGLHVWYGHALKCSGESNLETACTDSIAMIVDRIIQLIT